MVVSFSHTGFVPTKALWRVLTWPARVSAARRTMSNLARMSEYELRDIGLTRSDVNDATALPLDADPSGLLVRRRAWRERSVRRTNRSRGLSARASPPQRRRKGLGLASQTFHRLCGGALMTAHSAVAGVEINAKPSGRQDEILSAEALAFVAGLHRRFNRRRLRAARRGAWSGRKTSTPASCRTFSPRRRRSATATGRSRRSRPTFSTAGSRSPARSTAR